MQNSTIKPKYYLSDINRTTLTETEKSIVNSLSSTMKGTDPMFTREEGLHISFLHSDIQETPDEYDFTESDFLRFLDKFNIDANWETNQKIFI